MVCGCGVVGAQTVGSRLMVACVAIGMDARAVVMRWPYVTPFGLMRETALSRDVVEAAAAARTGRR